MEFDETPRFWCPRVTLAAWISFAFSPDKNLRSDFHISKKKRREEKIKIKISLHCHAHLPSFGYFSFLSFLFIYLLLLLLLYCYLNTRLILSHSDPFLPQKIYLFSVHFILNELSSSHFLTSEIFVKISSLKSLTAYHPKNRKIFHLSQNSTKLFWVTKFREMNLTAQSVSSSEI